MRRALSARGQQNPGDGSAGNRNRAAGGPSGYIDPKFSAALTEAPESGVQALGRECGVLNNRVGLGEGVGMRTW